MKNYTIKHIHSCLGAFNGSLYFVKGWLYKSDKTNYIVVLDNNSNIRLNYELAYFEILETTKIVRKSKLDKIYKE